MPIYEYECTSCCFNFEQRQSFDAESRSDCPRCQNQARRIFHPSPIIFKGSGFYVTDHGKGSCTPSQSKSKETEETKETKDTKTAAASKPADAK